jgi:CRP-like cAMP-binding protein
MPNKARPQGKSINPSSGTDGHAVKNRILLALGRNRREQVFAKLEFVNLPVTTILNETGEPIAFGYFINAGLASVLSVMEDGKSVEVGLIGLEGFVGLPLASGLRTSPTRTIMQVAGSGFRISAKDLGAAFDGCGPLKTSLFRYSHELTMQATQVAACNRVHEVDERLARWLLMSQDRLGGDTVPLTQDFLAHMLGTRRASVTVAAGILQKAGLITYTRGVVKIENRRLLIDATCECYGLLTRQAQAWRDEV